MRGGSLRHRIVVERPVEAQAADGSIVTTWETFATAWASIEPLVGREYFAQQREQATVSHKIRMRYLPGITHKIRLVWGSRAFEIESVLNVAERNRELVLMANETV
jgi:SPP1 family predicted phage head-tail adaptor